MFRIAICDNDVQDLRHIYAQICAYLNTHPEMDGIVEMFDAPAKLMDVLTDGKGYDTYILDIMMPKINGIQLGNYIRRKEEQATIIFTTSSADFALDAYGIHALRYLVKPVQKKELVSALELAYFFCTNRLKEVFSIKSRDGIIQVDPNDIVLVENISRSAVYTLNNGKIIFGICNRSTFEDAVESLAGNAHFLHPHKSFFVNMRFIRALGNDMIVLDNGREIPVSQKNASVIKREYLRYLSQKGDDL